MKNKTGRTTTIAGYKTGSIIPWVQGLFTFHTGKGKSEPKFTEINLAAQEFANVLVKNMPQGEELNTVLRTVQKVVLAANSSIQLELAPSIPFLGAGNLGMEAPGVDA